MIALHGFTGEGLDYALLNDGLGDALDLLAPDLVGHGCSEAPLPLERYRITSCAADVWGWTQTMVRSQHTTGTKPVLLGYSMGGRTALTTAVAHPEAWSALILVGATAGIREPSAQQARQATDRKRAEQLRTEGLEAFLERWRRVPIIATQERIPEPWQSAIRTRRLKVNTAEGLARSLEGMGTGTMPPLWEQLGVLKCPVLLTVGAEDTKFRRIAEAMQPLLGGYTERVSIAGAGHAAHLEAPQAFHAQLRRFLEKIAVL
ncbi:MAG: alpha/beta fold hydrolase [Myxococcota bacterium]